MWLEYQNWSDLNSYSFQISGFSLLVLSLGNVYSKVRITITFRCFNYSVFPGPLFTYFKITKQNEIGLWVSHWSFLNFSFNTNSVSRSTYLCVILVYGLGLWPWNPMLRTLALKCCLTNFYFWMAGSEKAHKNTVQIHSMNSWNWWLLACHPSFIHLLADGFIMNLRTWQEGRNFKWHSYGYLAN